MYRTLRWMLIAAFLVATPLWLACGEDGADAGGGDDTDDTTEEQGGGDDDTSYGSLVIDWENPVPRGGDVDGEPQEEEPHPETVALPEELVPEDFDPSELEIGSAEVELGDRSRGSTWALHAQNTTGGMAYFAFAYPHPTDDQGNFTWVSEGWFQVRPNQTVLVYPEYPFEHVFVSISASAGSVPDQLADDQISETKWFGARHVLQNFRLVDAHQVVQGRSYSSNRRKYQLFHLGDQPREVAIIR